MKRVTVTQLPDTPAELEAAFEHLIDHVRAERSDLVLLPEMPFYPWVANTQTVDPARWQAAVDAHEEWLTRLAVLEAGLILGTRPVLVPETVENAKRSPNEPSFSGLVRHNDAFIYTKDTGVQFAHRKYYLPNEPLFWEATWYQRAARPSFQAVQAGDLKIGFMICSDLWFGEHARGYARQGIHILANPRGTESASVDKWIAGGRTLAVMSGAYCISSNRSGESQGVHWGGAGWVIDPNGSVIARTRDAEPFITVEIDPAKAEAAKSTYPRDLKE